MLPLLAPNTPRIRNLLLEIGKADGMMDAKDRKVTVVRLRKLAYPHAIKPAMTADFTFLSQRIKHDMLKYNVPRNAQSVALIAQPRNDSNLILSQLHLPF